MREVDLGYTDKIIFCDIDGTISDDSERGKTLAFVLNPTQKEYHNYNKDCYQDKTIKPMCDLLKSVEDWWTIVLATARPEKYRKDTEDWLGLYPIPYTTLLMRPEGNLQSSPDLKWDMLQSIKTEYDTEIIVIDNREDVLRRLSMKNNVTTLLVRR